MNRLKNKNNKKNNESSPVKFSRLYSVLLSKLQLLGMPNDVIVCYLSFNLITDHRAWVSIYEALINSHHEELKEIVKLRKKLISLSINWE